MKILLIRTTGGMSGTETHNILLCRDLLKHKNIDVHVLTNYTPFFRKIRKNHIPSSLVFFPIREAGTNRELFFSVLWFLPMVIIYILKIRSIEKNKKFDTIVLESMTEKLFLSPYLKILGYRVIWIEQGSLFNTTRSFAVKKMYAYKSKWPDAILAVSEDTRRDLIRGGVPSSKIKVVHIGVDRVSAKSEKGTKKSKKMVIGFLGSVTHEKGIKEFLDAAYSIAQLHAHTSFYVIGGGPLMEWAKQYVKKGAIEGKITFTGYVDNPSEYLEKIDILYFPTHHHEGLSLAVLEALAIGKIVVARDIGGNRELIIDKKTGFLFHSDTGGKQILKDIVLGDIATAAVRKGAGDHIRKNFLMKRQITKFMDIFHG